ncbi:RNA methyltransferase [Clostridium aestuarii]|uniref:RNA methyltransferase n=1 Tax=Clostridium aestuarii TaxID=338193 RepID=A0ABT4CXD9_9CLOT|nr:RNA methyltransferase [Clostridium aestuarii]MCY6482765.1 RNA methyltransferase [Clostridium aestuarii]
MNIIESRDNSLVKDIKKLHKKKYRNEKGEFIVEGFRFVTEALQSDFEVPYVFIGENQMDRYNNFKIQDFLQENTKVYCIPESILKELCDTNNPQGILAVVNNKIIKTEDRDGFYVLVDKIQDPGNMGTIIRTAHASGAIGVVITKGTVDIYNNKTLRSTMGSVFKIPIIQDENLNVITDLKKKGFKLIVSSLEAENNFYDVDLTKKVIISVGNEGNGISKEVDDFADMKVKIPMPGGAESLNAAVSASVMMYEALRQRTFGLK